MNIARLLLNHQQLMNPIPVSLHFTELTWTLSHDILLIPLNFGKQSLLTIVSLVCGTRGAPHYHLICKAIFHWAIIFCYVTCMCVKFFHGSHVTVILGWPTLPFYSILQCQDERVGKTNVSMDIFVFSLLERDGAICCLQAGRPTLNSAVKEANKTKTWTRLVSSQA